MKKLFEDAELELIRFKKSDIIVTSSLEEVDTDSENPDDEVVDGGDTAPQSDDGGIVTDIPEI